MTTETKTPEEYEWPKTPVPESVQARMMPLIKAVSQEHGHACGVKGLLSTPELDFAMAMAISGAAVLGFREGAKTGGQTEEEKNWIGESTLEHRNAELAKRVGELERERDNHHEIAHIAHLNLKTTEGECDRLQSERDAAIADRDRLTAQLAAAQADSRRVDWLESMTVNVRIPLVHGSRDLFWASLDENDGEETPSDIRKQIDAAMSTPPEA